MFEFTFKDSEYEALNNLLGTCCENKDAQLPIWIYLGCDMWTMDLDVDQTPKNDGHPDEGDKSK